MRQRTIVTGVIGSDTHIIGNRILGMALEQAGYKVVALGARKRRIRARARNTERLRDFGADRQAAQRQIDYVKKPDRRGCGERQAKAEGQ